MTFEFEMATRIRQLEKQMRFLQGLESLAGFDQQPSGVVSQFAGSSAPDGYLLCKGQAISRATYAELFTAIGTTYGAGNGSTTFNVPNLQGRVPVGVSDSDGDFDLSDNGGAKTHTLTTAQMPAHNHTQSAHSHVLNTKLLRDYSWGVSSGGSAHIIDRIYGNSNEGTTSQTPGIQNTGGGLAHNNLQPYITMNYIIKI